MPTRVACPHCKARLQYADTGVVVATLVALLLTCAAGAFFFVLRFYPLVRYEFAFYWAALILVIWLPLELAVAIYLRNAKVLRNVDAVQSQAEDSAN